MPSDLTRLGAFLVALAIFATGCTENAEKPVNPPPNVLLIVVDDLNTDLGAYGHSIVESPSIDRLAAQGLTFDAAYAQYTVCSPSRSSFMTGLYPRQTGVVSNDVHFRDFVPQVQTLPELFRANGYYTARVGKIFHYNVPGHIGTDGLDDPQSWMERRNPRGVDVDFGKDVYSIHPDGPTGATLTWLSTDDDGSGHTDALVTDAAAELMREQHPDRTGKPFFLAVGYYRPHTPFVAPRVYFDRYPISGLALPPEYEADRVDIPIPALPDRPGQLSMSDDEKLAAIQAYYASITYVDAQIGRLLDALEAESLDHSTVVVLISDHGFLLGQHGLWQKGDLFEGSTRVPMIVSIPEAVRTNAARSTRTDAVVELVDLYPTVAEIAGLSLPAHLAGISLVPIVEDPEADVREYAYSLGLSGAGRNRPEWAYREVYGHTVRSARYRYTEWAGGQLGVELYDYQADPEEQTNLVNHREYLAVRARLARGLAKRRQGAAVLAADIQAELTECLSGCPEGRLRPSSAALPSGRR